MRDENLQLLADDPDQIYEPVGYDFGTSRRNFVQALGAGLLISIAIPALGQEASRGSGEGGQGYRRQGGGRGGDRQPTPISARLHIARDGTITVLSGKVEGGQGARGQIAQAAAEELHVPVEQLKLVLADTALTPDDGPTVGSRTTPSTIPAVRQACAAARQLKENLAKQKGRELTWAEFAADIDLKQPTPRDVQVTPVTEWKTLGTPVARPNARDLVTGAHQYPSDVIREGMLYAKVLRPPAYGAKLSAIDLAVAESMKDVVVVRGKDFVAVAAPTTHAAKKAIAALEKTAKWDSPPHPSSKTLNAHLREHAEGGMPADPNAKDFDAAKIKLTATYSIPYVQHAPMEPRAAVAEWADGHLTVWTATQNPFRVRGEIAEALHIAPEKVRVIVPDFGGGFGGKHTGECAVEAARIALAAKKPVALRWIRKEEFSWAYFRPAALMEMAASLTDTGGKLANWHFVNVNAGRSGLESPYRCEKKNEKSVNSDPPLRHGSYRALASVANHFGRECFIDELARAANADPLEFRRAHLALPDDSRLHAVLDAVARPMLEAGATPGRGLGLACGTEKGSFVATAALVRVDRAAGTITVEKLWAAFECGKITTPSNLRQQVLGGIIQALGPVFRESSDFENGAITNASFWKYQVPRFGDVPQIELSLLDRPDLPSVGAGETPLICVAPSIANAVFDACGVRLRDLPLKLPATV